MARHDRIVAAALFLAACAPRPELPVTPDQSNLASEIIRTRDETAPDHAFGSNIAGSIVGGLTEAL